MNLFLPVFGVRTIQRKACKEQFRDFAKVSQLIERATQVGKLPLLGKVTNKTIA